MANPSPSPSSLLKKISIISSKPRAFRVAILGQNGVGKSALTVRFITKRYIGDYAPELERVYSCQRHIHGSSVDFEIWDTAGLNENSKLREHIRWADAILLMYDVTDRCSFNECSRLKFLINAHSRRSRRKTGSDPDSELSTSIPVAMVANKKDREHDRMVMSEEGATRSVQLNCVSFHEVSVREDVDDVIDVLDELYMAHRKSRKSRTLTQSKLSLFVPDKNGGSSSDEEPDDGNGNGIRGSGVSRGKGRVTGCDTKDESFTSRAELIKRAKSRRREAFYSISN